MLEKPASPSRSDPIGLHEQMLHPKDGPLITQGVETDHAFILFCDEDRMLAYVVRRQGKVPATGPQEILVVSPMGLRAQRELGQQLRFARPRAPDSRTHWNGGKRNPYSSHNDGMRSRSTSRP